MLGPLNAAVERRPISDAIFDILRDAVVDGRLAPGQWLRQEALAQELNVSQMPVREALRRLVAEGLADSVPYKGIRVVEFSRQDIIDLYTIRLALEGLAVGFATPLISDADLDRLRANLDQAARLTAQDDMARRRELNAEFHLTICRASGHRFLVRQIEALWDWFPSVLLYEGMRRQEDLAVPRLAREHQEHAAILAALERRDADQAEEAARCHIRNLMAELAEVLGLPRDDTLFIPFKGGY